MRLTKQMVRMYDACLNIKKKNLKKEKKWGNLNEKYDKKRIISNDEQEGVSGMQWSW